MPLYFTDLGLYLDNPSPVQERYCFAECAATLKPNDDPTRYAAMPVWLDSALQLAATRWAEMRANPQTY